MQEIETGAVENSGIVEIKMNCEKCKSILGKFAMKDFRCDTT